MTKHNKNEMKRKTSKKMKDTDNVSSKKFGPLKRKRNPFFI